MNIIKEKNKTLKKQTAKPEKKNRFSGKRKSRQKNLVIKNVGDQKKDGKKIKKKVAYILQKIKVKCNLKIDADKIKKIRKYKANRKRSIIIKLTVRIKKAKY